MATTPTGTLRSSAAAAMTLVAALLVLATGNAPRAAESERLTQGSVKRFIASYPEVKTIAVNQASAKGKKIGGSDNALLAVVEAASDDSIKGEIEGAARRHGFRDGKEWFGVARSVGVAYAHMKSGVSVDAKAQQKLEKAIAKVEDMPLLSDKQKKKLVADLRKGASVVLEPPPPENVAVVKAMAPQIEAVVK
jgi:hypothetical protein